MLCDSTPGDTWTHIYSSPYGADYRPSSGYLRIPTEWNNELYQGYFMDVGEALLIGAEKI